jgi:6-phosphogluconate dehydrogenase
MQIGMIGLGRMGANMVHRLLRAGHQCVVYDINPKAVAGLVEAGATLVLPQFEEFVEKLTPPRAAWLMLPAAIHRRQCAKPVCADGEPGDTIIDGGNSNYKDAIDLAAELAPRGINFVDVGTSGGVWGLERGYCLMIGGPKDAVSRLDPIFTIACPQWRCSPLAPDRHRAAGFSALRAQRRWPFCERWCTTASNTA